MTAGATTAKNLRVEVTDSIPAKDRPELTAVETQAETTREYHLDCEVVWNGILQVKEVDARAFSIVLELKRQ